MIAEQPQTRSLLTVRQFSQKYPAFPEGGLRYQIFHAGQNGLAKALRRIGRKVLIDESAYFRWVDAQNGQGGAI